MLYLLVMAVVLLLVCAISTFNMKANKELGLAKFSLLTIGPVIDALIGYWIFGWLGFSELNSALAGFCVGFFSHLLMQPLVLSKRGLGWNLARKNVMRRKRQAGLLLAGLVITSAIISSSLIIGDSLDATVLHEVEAAYDETDLMISGIDPFTGDSVEFNETMAASLWDSIQTDSFLSSQVTGRQFGYSDAVSIGTDSGKGSASVSWFARNATIDAQGPWSALGSGDTRFSDLYEANQNSQLTMAIINQVLADELDLSTGDEFNVDWFIASDEGRERIEGRFVVLEVVDNVGQGARGGTGSGAIFTDLSTSQRLHQAPGMLNNIAFSLKGDSNVRTDVEPIVEAIEPLVDEMILASHVGVSLTRDEASSTLSVSSSAGLGRLSGDDVEAVKGNMTSLVGNATLLEVLQIPLIDFSYDNEQIITLAGQEVKELQWGERALWHLVQDGAGFQIGGDGDAWIWRTPNGELAQDLALYNDPVTGNTIGAVSYSGGVISGGEHNLDDATLATWKQDSVHALATYGWGFVALHGEDTLHLTHLDSDLNFVSAKILDVDIPSTVLNYDLVVDSEIYLSIEGLLSTDYYSINGASAQSTITEISEQDGEEKFASGQVPGNLSDGCNGVAWEFREQTNWCSSDLGLLGWSEGSDDLSLRLPLLAEAEGLGTMPQMFLAFGGENTPLEVERGSILGANRLAALKLDNQSEVWVKGLIPYSTGDSNSHRLTYAGEYSSVEGFESLESLDGLVLGIISLRDGEELAMAEENGRSMLMISLANSEVSLDQGELALLEFLDERATMDDVNLYINPVKVSAAESAAESSGVISGMFLVFGIFTIAAGVLLALTIIIMLAESRQSELAVARALGMLKSDVRYIAIAEGSIIAVLASLVGTVLGLGLAYLISIGFDYVFASVGSSLFRFSWQFDSLMSGWIWGFIISVVTISITSFWTSGLNIVGAIRGNVASKGYNLPWLLLLIQIVSLGGGAMMGLFLLIYGLDGMFSYLLWTVMGVCLIVALTPVVTWVVPIVLRKRSSKMLALARNARRNTLSALGVLLLLWTLDFLGLDFVRANMEADELSFVIIGLVQVFAGVLILTSLAAQVVQRLGKSKIVTKFLGPTLPVALAHPLSSPVRTAVVMGMFSITVFSVIVLGGYAEQFDNYSAGFVHEAEGEFEILLTGTTTRPLDLGNDTSLWNLNTTDSRDIDAIGTVSLATVFLEDYAGERMPYYLRGFDDGFSSHGGLPLYEWDPSLGETQRDAWTSIGNRDDIVAVDASFALQSAADGTTLVPLNFSIGDSILLIENSNPANTRYVTVGAILEQSSYLFSAGVWMNEEIVNEQFDGRVTRMYISIDENAQPSDDFDTSDLSTFAPGGKSSSERFAAKELSEQLQVDLADQGVTVMVISDEIMLIQSLILSILAIFEGYLALGLIVGIAGIGVVTVRSVSERRKTIGVLRALGYTKRMVALSFIIEISWVALLGILNGVLIAISFHKMLYDAFWKDQGAAFSLPYESIFLIFFASWALVILATLVPIRRAMSIPPSAALRSA